MRFFSFSFIVGGGVHVAIAFNANHGFRPTTLCGRRRIYRRGSELGVPSHHLDELPTPETEINVFVLLMFEHAGVVAAHEFQSALDISIEDTSTNLLADDGLDIIVLTRECDWGIGRIQVPLSAVHVARERFRRLRVTFVSQVLANDAMDESILIVGRMDMGDIGLVDAVEHGFPFLVHHAIDVENERSLAEIDSEVFTELFHPDGWEQSIGFYAAKSRTCASEKQNMSALQPIKTNS